MPYTLNNPDNPSGYQSPREDLGYKYPGELNLQPSSDLHKRIMTEVITRAQISTGVTKKKHSSWNQVEKSLTAYIDLTVSEQAVKTQDSRKPVSVVVPLSFATLDTLLTYYTSQFFTSPLFPYRGVGPEDTLPVAKLEQVIDLQARKNKHALSLYTMWRDSFVYGFGAVSPSWEQTMGFSSERQTLGFWSVLNRFIPTTTKVTKSEVVKFEGNRLYSIDPYNYLPDPTVPVTEPQRGDFVGWIQATSYHGLLSQESRSDGSMFNVKYLKGARGQSQFNVEGKSSREDRWGGRPSTAIFQPPEVSSIDVIWLYVNLVPKDWKLSERETPQKWLFGLAADSIVIKAEPLDLDHGMFPVAVSAPEHDGHSVLALSKMEIVYPLQQIVDWMLKSHVENVRKALNDMLIVDPLLVNIDDLRSPEPGKIIRLRKQAWGRGVGDAVRQLTINDVTKQHVAEIPFLADLIFRITGAVDIVQGVMAGGPERRSALEARDARVAALSRLQRMASITMMQAHWDLQEMLASQTQQFMSQASYVRAVGRLADALEREYGQQQGSVMGMKVEPDEILGNYDVVPGETGDSGGENAGMWIQLLQQASTNPELAQRVDILRTFLHVARIMGAKNIQDFLRQGGQVNMNTMGDEQIASQAQAGNIVPVQEVMGNEPDQRAGLGLPS